MVISPGFQDEDIELNAWIDTPEFRKRLSRTIEFLDKEKRPHWQSIVAEQEKFPGSIQNQE